MKIITDAIHIDKIKWNDFIMNHPNGNIFQTPEMYDVFKNTKNYEPISIAILDENKIEALLLAVIQKENYGILSHLTSRSIIWGGPLINSKKPHLLDTIIKEYTKKIKHKAIYTQIRNFILYDKVQKDFFNKNGYDYKDHLNILIDLNIGVDGLWKEIKRNRKDGINKAKKQGFIFKVADKLDNLDDFYFLLKESYKKIKLPYPDISFFQSLNNTLKENTKWFIMEYLGKPRIILCALKYNNVLYAFFIGISQDKNFHKLRPVDLFYWEVIKWASENQIKYFDWMGAGKPNKEYGVRDFKLQYGGNFFNSGRFEKKHSRLLFNIGKTGLYIWKIIK